MLSYNFNIQGSKGIRQWPDKLIYIPNDDTQNFKDYNYIVVVTFKQ